MINHTHTHKEPMVAPPPPTNNNTVGKWMLVGSSFTGNTCTCQDGGTWAYHIQAETLDRIYVDQKAGVVAGGSPITITSTDFDIADVHRFAWRIA